MSHISPPQIDEMILIYSLIIEDIIKITDNLNHSVSIFDSLLRNKVSILQFLERIQLYTEFETDILKASMMYIDKFCQNNPKFYLNSTNCHQLILASIILSFKQHDDLIISNQLFAKICEIDPEELVKMTFLFFEKINFSTLINEEEFMKYNEKIENYMSRKRCREKLEKEKETRALSFYKTCVFRSANLYI